MKLSFDWPYEFQPVAADVIAGWLRQAKAGDRALWTAPTGSGKGVVEALVQAQLDGCWVVTPRLEIAEAILEKKGVGTDDVVAAGWEHRVVTPIRFRNALLRGEVQRVPYVIHDEAHHGIAETWQQSGLLAGMPPMAGLTATAYRGSPRSTRALLDFWGQPRPIVTLREAVQRGIVAVPEWRVLPLVDDDVVGLGPDGDFDVLSLESAYSDRLGDLAEQSRQWVGPDALWDLPTLFCVPGVATAKRLAGELQSRGLAAMELLGGTPRSVRSQLFKMCVARLAAVVHVAVVGEGVDLPIRRLVDAAPCMSPVKWVQQLGRCTRPWDRRPEYVCTNRNLQRHCYLMDGFCPPSAIAEAEAAFGGPGRRPGVRALGLEAIGRFRAGEVRLADGLTAHIYTLVDCANGRMREMACLVHPCVAEAMWAERVHGRNDNGTKNYGAWRKCEAPRDLKGFASAPEREPSEKMAAFWKRSALGRGLDATVAPNRKTFVALPFLLDQGISFRRR